MDSLVIQIVAEPRDDEAEVHRFATSLARDLLATTDIRRVDDLPAEFSPGTKGLGSVVGALAVDIGHLETLASVLRRVREWMRGSRRSCQVTINGNSLVIEYPTADQQERIIAAWLAEVTEAHQSEADKDASGS